MDTVAAETISIRVASERFGISESTLRQWISQNRLPAYLVCGTRVRVRVADLQALFVPIHKEKIRG